MTTKSTPARSAATAADPHAKYRRQFYRHFLRALLVSGTVISISLLMGILGYHFICDLEWVDALLNASMILTGMGPVATLTTNGAKVFASAYALFSGVIFITASGILIAPMFHHILHKFHLEQKDIQ
jgi:hypothetical protein